MVFFWESRSILNSNLFESIMHLSPSTLLISPQVNFPIGYASLSLSEYHINAVLHTNPKYDISLSVPQSSDGGRGKNEHWFFTFSMGINCPHGRGKQPVNSSRGFQILHLCYNNTYICIKIWFLPQFTHFYQTFHIFTCISFVLPAASSETVTLLWSTTKLFSNIWSQVFCKTLGHNSFKNENWLFASNIAALFTSHRWAHTPVDLSYMKFWNFEGKLSAWFEIKEKHSRAERRKSYLSPISISLRLLLIFWYMELSALIWG